MPTSFHMLHLIHQWQGYHDLEMQLISVPKKNKSEKALATELMRIEKQKYLQYKLPSISQLTVTIKHAWVGLYKFAYFTYRKETKSLMLMRTKSFILY